jgi:hypothetical protein
MLTIALGSGFGGLAASASARDAKYRGVAIRRPGSQRTNAQGAAARAASQASGLA